VTIEELIDELGGAPWIEHGRSRQDRPLTHRVWRCGSASIAPVLFHAGIHGNEPLGVYCLRELAIELETFPLDRDVWLVPAVNPDGLLLDDKHNAAGVDLNRNFPASNWSPVQAGKAYPGPSPASEPETRALAEIIERAAPARIITLHSPFRTVNYDGPAQALAERMAARNGYGASADIGYPTPGSFGSLYGVDRGLEVITLEIPPMSPAQAWQENREALLEALTD
jgi:protein MpaA